MRTPPSAHASAPFLADAAARPVVAGGRRVRASGGRAEAPRALGRAVAPRGMTLVLPRGTHRTRVSEMRLAGACVAGSPGTRRAIAHGGGRAVRPGTG